MAPSPESPIPAARRLRPLVTLGILGILACDLGTRAVAREQPTPFLAAAAKPTPAERKAKRAARQANVDTIKNVDTTKNVDKTKKPAASKPPAALPPCPPDNPLTYRSFGDGFLRTWCTGCHSSTLAASDRQDAPLGVDFDRAALYKPHARDIYDRAVLEAHAAATDPSASASPMPPAGIVPEADLRRLGQWIACGSPGA